MRGQPHAPAALYPRERPVSHCTGGWVGPRAGLYRCGKSRPPPGFDPRTVQPLASSYTDYAIRPTSPEEPGTNFSILYVSGPHWPTESSGAAVSAPQLWPVTVHYMHHVLKDPSYDWNSYKVVQIWPGLFTRVNKCKQSRSYLNHLVLYVHCSALKIVH